MRTDVLFKNYWYYDVGLFSGPIVFDYGCHVASTRIIGLRTECILGMRHFSLMGDYIFKHVVENIVAANS